MQPVQFLTPDENAHKVSQLNCTSDIFQLYLLFESYLANKLHAYLLILCYTSNFK